MDSFGVYIHVPYCRTICPYCDFNVHAAQTHPWPQLAQSIIREMNRRAPLFEDKRVGSIYFGGGTPSLAPPEFFSAIITAIEGRFEHFGHYEITGEINPGTIDLAGLEKWRSLGINRASLGWQTTHERLMKVLGRDHSVEDSYGAFYDARRAGFDNISVDLIFGVPGQKNSELEDDLERVIELKPDHISIYEMTFHKGTPYAFYRQEGRLKPLADESVLAMTLKVEEALQQASYEQYEISNFARANKRSEHN